MRRYRRICAAIPASASLIFTLCVVSSAAAQEAPKLEKPTAAAVTLYSEAANLQNQKQFNVAAGLWESFVTKYPATELTPKAEHYAGVCQLQLQQFDKAEPHFQAVVTKWLNVPDLNLYEDAYLNLGWCQYTRARQTPEGAAALFDQAATSFGTLLAKFPEGKFADQALYFQGESLYLQGKRQESLASYQQLVDKFPKSTLRVNALYALGVAQEELDQYPGAGTTFDLFLAEFADSPLATEIRMRKAETVLQAGLTTAGAGKVDEAKVLYGQAATMFGEAVAAPGFGMTAHALSRQAYSVLLQDKFVEAGDLYARVATEFKDSSSAAASKLSAGQSYYRGGKFDEATKWFEQVVQENGAGTPEAAHWLCRIYLRDKQPAKAAELATKVLPQAGTSEYLVNLMMDQADGLYEQPEHKAESLPLYVKIATDQAASPSAPQALYNAAFTAMELKQYDQAIAHAGTFLKAYAEHNLVPDVKYVAAESNLLLEKFAEAEAGYQDLLKAHGTHPDASAWPVRLGWALHLQGKHAETVAALTPVIGALPDPARVAEAQYLIGTSQFTLQKFPEATTALTASLAADAKWARADETLLLLSRAQFAQQQSAEASQTAQRLLTEFPTSKFAAEAHYRLGEYAYDAKDYKTATAEYTAVGATTADSPFVPFALYGKGWSLLQSGDYPMATTDFTSLLTTYPTHQLATDTYLARGMCYRQAQQYKEAVADLTEFLKSNPAPALKSSALYERGLSESSLKDYAAAAATFTALLTEDPTSSIADKALYELAWAYKFADKQPEALANFAKIVAEHPDSPLAAESYFHLGEDLYGKEQYAEAAKSYTSAKQKAGKTVVGEKATYKLGWSNFQLKQYDAALAEFQDQKLNYPDGELKADGLFMVAECLFRQEKYKEALPAYNAALAAAETAEKIPADVKVLILLHGGQSAAESSEWDAALKLLQPIPTTYAESGLIPEANFEIGRALQGLGKNPEALEAYEKAASVSLGEVGARARYMVGEIYFANKEHDEAVKQFKRVMFGFGGETASAEVKKWQGFAGYEAGRCAQTRIATEQDAKKKAQLIAEAKEYYTFVVEKHPDSTLAPEAQKQLVALGK